MTLKLGLPGSMTDATLCQILLDKGRLTDMQLAELVTAAARVSAGGKLAKNERDRMMAIAMAQGLTKRTQIKRRSDAPTMNLGDDLFSTRWTKGTDRAVEILKQAKTPSGHMIVPPGRRRTG